MLFNEPKLLKYIYDVDAIRVDRGFSALQRAEIAEMRYARMMHCRSSPSFSALQRAEIAEIQL